MLRAQDTRQGQQQQEQPQQQYLRKQLHGKLSGKTVDILPVPPQKITIHNRKTVKATTRNRKGSTLIQA